MLQVVRMIAAALCALMLGAVQGSAAESLPMPSAHYADLCAASGGVMSFQLSGSFGTAQCRWADQGRTECKVANNAIKACAIACLSNGCLKANPDRFNPKWPLEGGPNSAALPASPVGGTLAPAN